MFPVHMGLSSLQHQAADLAAKGKPVQSWKAVPAQVPYGAEHHSSQRSMDVSTK